MVSLMKFIEPGKIILQKHLENRGDRNTLPTHFMWSTLPMLKPKKDITRKHAKCLNTVSACQIQQYIKRIIHYPRRVCPGNASLV